MEWNRWSARVALESMMTMQVGVFCLALACMHILWACTSQADDADVLTLSEHNRDLDTSAYLDRCDVVVLELTDESCLASIKEIQISDSLIYVLDSRHKVVCFGRDGAFRYVIDARGSGPGEYSRLCDISLDRQNGILSLLSPDKVLKYDAIGNYIGGYSTDGSFLELVSDGGEVTALRYPYPDGIPAKITICVLDGDGAVRNGYLPAHWPLAPFDFGLDKSLVCQDGGVWHVRRGDKCVYDVADRCRVAFELDWRDMEFQPDHGEDYSYQELMQLCRDENKIFGASNFAKSDKSAYLATNLGHAFADLAAQSMVSCVYLRDAASGVLLPHGIPVDGTSGMIVFPVNPLNILNIRINGDNAEFLSGLRGKIDADSNPVLFVYALRG